MQLPDPLLLLVEGFEKLRVKYMITGSVAAMIYGEPRFTNDMDVVARISRGDARRFAQVFPSTDFDVPPEETIVTEAARPRYGHFNVIHVESTFRADVYLAGDDPLNREAFLLRRRMKSGGTEFWVAPPEYVILHKLKYFREAGGDRHPRDIRAMLIVSGATIDQRLIEAKARALGLEAEWGAVLATPGSAS